LTIQWDAFTPAHALAGGVLIGLSAGLLALLDGGLAGISGIVGGLLDAIGDRAWRLLFLAGLLLAAPLYQRVTAYPAVSVTQNVPLLVIAGFLVGVGTRYGAGCTSGHGVCGLARLSPRSMVATLTFMAAGFATVFVVRHVVSG
jgi:uncharacterized membrane protein YedE/YeeE